MPRNHRPRGLRESCRIDAHENRGGSFKESKPEVRLVDGINPHDFIDILKDHIHRPYEKAAQEDDSIASWRTHPEIPTGAEIMSPTPHLPSNPVDRPWADATTYISTHYSLHREDGISPLRDALDYFKSNPAVSDDNDIAIYTNVHIVGYTFSNLGPAARIQFSTERSGKRIRWAQSKRLTQGAILAMSPSRDNFSTICKIVVVAARPLSGLALNPPELDVFWGSSDDAELDPSESFVMVEAKSGYFEAKRHMLVAMQKLVTEGFHMEKYLVSLQKDIDTSSFIKTQPLRDMRSLVSPTIMDSDQVDVNASPIEDPLENFNVDVIKWPIIEGSRLDTSQTAALKRMLIKKVALIQGPPGTGKSFVCVSALKIILDNWKEGDAPIVIAAQTNHALDQLLMHIMKSEEMVVRLGGRTDRANEEIRRRTLYEVRLKAPGAAKTPYANYKNVKKALEDQATRLKNDIERAITQREDEAEIMRDLGIITQQQYESLVDDSFMGFTGKDLPEGPFADWLGEEQISVTAGCPPENMGFEEEELDPRFEELDEEEVENGKVNALKDDDDIDHLRGQYYSIKEAFVGRASRGTSLQQVKKWLKAADLNKIPVSNRGGVYRYLRKQLKATMLSEFRSHFKEYMRSTQNLKVSRWQSDAFMIKRLGIKLIACTTTGLSKYRGLLAALKTRSLLIEEAAETTEAAILASLFETIEQLVLVGDHQQLQANCDVQALGQAPYNLFVSMFERLVTNGLEYTMLNVQRRMVPEIRAILDPFYPGLKDHPSVDDRMVHRQPIPGMGGRNHYFFHHTWPESRDDTSSRSNLEEAEMIVHFFGYLVLNGTDASQITVLTFYNGQRRQILSMLKKKDTLIASNSFKVYTVDSYQGEENDIILLSLVRSNESGNIGFLENKNRAVVSLSRARRGFYIFGNAVNLLRIRMGEDELWAKVTDTFLTQRRIDICDGFPIVCKNHGIETTIKTSEGWAQVTGGCARICGGLLPCGHKCPYKCHPFPHSDIVCKEPCNRSRPCEHACSERCGDDFCSCAFCEVVPLPPTGDHEFGSSPMDSKPNSTETTLIVSRLAPVKQNHAESTNVENSDHYSPRVWQSWDAERADTEAARDASAVASRPHLGNRSRPIYHETHRPITTSSGVRVHQPNNISERIIKNGNSMPESAPASSGRNNDHSPVYKPSGLANSTDTPDYGSSSETVGLGTVQPLISLDTPNIVNIPQASVPYSFIPIYDDVFLNFNGIGNSLDSAAIEDDLIDFD